MKCYKPWMFGEKVLDEAMPFGTKKCYVCGQVRPMEDFRSNKPTASCAACRARRNGGDPSHRRRENSASKR